MNKKYIYISIFLLTLFGQQGCSDDFLNASNPNRLTTSTFWKTADDAYQGTIAAYAGLQEEGTWKRWMDIAFGSRADLILSYSPWVEFSQYSKFHLPDYNWVLQGEIWDDHYRGIFRTNQVLANVPNIEMDEAEKNQLLSEARFLRAFYYFDLVNLWGNVPVVLQPSDPNDLPDYNTEAQVWEQIISDLTEAIPYLPDSYDEDQVGRVTKGAANALLGKTYMQLRRWPEAEAQFGKVINSPASYGLVADFRDNFKHTTENNIESVWEIQFSDEFKGPFWDRDVPTTSEGSRRAIYFAPRFASGNADAQPTAWFLQQFLLEKDKDGNIDPRTDATFLWFRPDSLGSQVTYGGQLFEEAVLDSTAFVRKYLNDYWKDVEDEHSPINLRIIRFADVLLMHAEALMMQGKTEEAIPLINRVRARANLLPLSTPAGGWTPELLLGQLKHERVLELGGESVRWTDLKRWNMLTTAEGVAELKTHDPEFADFELGKNDLLPIPTREIDLDPKLKQNPNY